MLQTKNDTRLAIQPQSNGQQKFGIPKTDTVFVARETTKSTEAENQHIDYRNQQRLKTKDDQIQRLQHQLNSMQNTSTRRPRQSFIFGNQSQHQPSNNQQPNQLSKQLLQSQNDTIQYLRSQLRNLQLEPRKRDSLNLEQQSKIVQHANIRLNQQQIANPG